jgi:hypothetical protein
LRKQELLTTCQFRVLLGVALIAMTLAALAGCGFSASAGAGRAVALHGTVQGGLQPVSGSNVQLYAAGISGVGSTALPLLSTAVRSENDGSFSIPASYFCPSPSSQLYVVARGGNPGLVPGTDNPALALTAALGACGSLSASAPVYVNEVTTIGSVWPIAAYMRSPTEIGSAPNDSNFLAAVSSVNQFISVATGESPGTATANSYFNQSPKLYSLADVLARCVHSVGGSAGDGSLCGALFSLATPPGASSPSDTMTAAMRIAQNPAQNVTGIYEQAAAHTFSQPALAAAPADWTLDLSHAVAAPSISLASGTYVGNQEVTISDTAAGSTIYYTTDGSLPTTSSPIYSGALSIAVSSTIEAIAVVGASQSPVSSSTLTITPAHPPVQLAFLQEPTNTLIHATISPAIKVAVEDANGNVLPSSTNPIAIALSGGATGLGGTLSVTPQNGIATFSNLTMSASGTAYTLLATSEGLTSATSTSFTISQPSPVPNPTGIAVTPGSIILTPSQTQTFTASVSGTSDQSVTWSLSPAVGSISALGLYIAPQTVPSSATVTITATSVLDPTVSGSTKVTIAPPQAAGYSLAWEDTFSTLSMCTTNVGGCNWYYPGLWNFGSFGVVSNPSGDYINLNWVNSQTYSTNVSTCSANGVYCHAWTYGYFEMSMAFNPANGNWPALWLMPVKYNSDSVHTGPELDVFEWQSQNPTAGYSTIHAWSNGADLGDAPAANAWPLPPGTDLSKFNTYGALWTPTAVYIYFNNLLVETISTKSAPFNTQFAGQYPMFIVLSETAGCNWTVSQTRVCSGQTSPLDMQVQWVHVYAPPSTN